jgi:mRNA interferase RelE/StbE
LFLSKTLKKSGMKDCYKIKLRSAGFRLFYQVRNSEILISVVTVGNQVYKIAIKRI